MAKFCYVICALVCFLNCGISAQRKPNPPPNPIFSDCSKCKPEICAQPDQVSALYDLKSIYN